MRDQPTTATGPHGSGPLRRARPAWALARGAPATTRVGRGATGPLRASLVGLLAHLRTAVMRYARDLHAGGACPEQVRVRLQEIAAEALAAAGVDDPAVVRVLTRQMVGWGLAAYHATAAGR